MLQVLFSIIIFLYLFQSLKLIKELGLIETGKSCPEIIDMAHMEIESSLGFEHFLKKVHVKLANDFDKHKIRVPADLHNFLCPYFEEVGMGKNSAIGKCCSIIHDCCKEALSSNTEFAEVCTTLQCYGEDDEKPKSQDQSPVPNSKDDIDMSLAILSFLLYCLAGVDFASITNHGTRAAGYYGQETPFSTPCGHVTLESRRKNLEDSWISLFQRRKFSNSNLKACMDKFLSNSLIIDNIPHYVILFFFIF